MENKGNNQFTPQFLYRQVVDYVFSGGSMIPIIRNSRSHGVVNRIQSAAADMMDDEGEILSPFVDHMKSFRSSLPDSFWSIKSPKKLKASFRINPFSFINELTQCDEFNFEISCLDTVPTPHIDARDGESIDSPYSPPLEEEIILNNPDIIRQIYESCRSSLLPLVGGSVSNIAQDHQDDVLFDLSCITSVLIGMMYIKRAERGSVCLSSQDGSVLEFKFEARGSWNHQPYFDAAAEIVEIERQIEVIDSIIESQESSVLDFKKAAVLLRGLINSTPELFADDSPYHEMIYELRSGVDIGDDFDGAPDGALDDVRASFSEISDFLCKIKRLRKRSGSLKYRH